MYQIHLAVEIKNGYERPLNGRARAWFIQPTCVLYWVALHQIVYTSNVEFHVKATFLLSNLD